MKIQLETFNSDSKSPFRHLHNPRLNNLFYWHFHPEYELVYIDGANATRHVGNHISRFEESDLVFIGSNIPHLNFDYGVQTDYKKEVLHIKPFYKDNVIGDIPELSGIQDLFKKSKYGIAFKGETKITIGKRLESLHTLSSFSLFIEVIEILKKLSESHEFELLHDHPFENKYNKKEQERLRNIYAFIDENYQRKIDIDEVASICNLGKEAFCRYFKKATGGTFVAFLNQYRISQAKRLFLTGMNVGETCFECGFESLSYFNRTFKKVANENPTEFKKKHPGI